MKHFRAWVTMTSMLRTKFLVYFTVVYGSFPLWNARVEEVCVKAGD